MMAFSRVRRRDPPPLQSCEGCLISIHSPNHPRALVVRVWAWLCAHTNSLDEKRRCPECPEAVLGLRPE